MHILLISQLTYFITTLYHVSPPPYQPTTTSITPSFPHYTTTRHLPPLQPPAPVTARSRRLDDEFAVQPGRRGMVSSGSRWTGSFEESARSSALRYGEHQMHTHTYCCCSSSSRSSYTVPSDVSMI